MDSREERNESDSVSDSVSVSEADCETEPGIDCESVVVERGDDSVVLSRPDAGDSKSGTVSPSPADLCVALSAFRSRARVWWRAGLSVFETTRWVRVPI